MDVTNKPPFFSIVIPVYNSELYIIDCLNSVIGQNFYSYEVIVVNDGSLDMSLNIIEEFALVNNKVTVFTQKNKGLGSARNTGIDKANGEYILFVDSDDSISKDCLSNLYKVSQTSKCDIIEFSYARVNHDGMLVNKTSRESQSNFDSIVSCNSDSCACNKLFLRTLFLDNKIKFPVGVFYEDIGTIYKIYFYAKHILSISHVLYFYYMRHNSITSVISERHIYDLFFVLRDTLNFLDFNDNADKEKLFRIRVLKCSIMLAKGIFASSHMQTDLYKLLLSNLSCFRYPNTHESFLEGIGEHETLADYEFYLGPNKSVDSGDESFDSENCLSRNGNRLKNMQLHKGNVALDFSRKFNRLIEQASLLNLSHKKIALYGYGVIGKIIKDILNEKVVLVVDQKAEKIEGCSLPDALRNADFEHVFICVLGREKHIKKFLIEKIGVEADKIGQVVF